MYKPITALLLWVLISSCSNKNQPTNADYILGNWVEVSVFRINDHTRFGPGPGYTKNGFTFYKDNTFEDRQGYLRYDTTIRRRIYLGNAGKYKIDGDSLLLFGPDRGILKYRL